MNTVSDVVTLAMPHGQSIKLSLVTTAAGTERVVLRIYSHPSTPRRAYAYALAAQVELGIACTPMHDAPFRLSALRLDAVAVVLRPAVPRSDARYKRASDHAYRLAKEIALKIGRIGLANMVTS